MKKAGTKPAFLLSLQGTGRTRPRFLVAEPDIPQLMDGICTGHGRFNLLHLSIFPYFHPALSGMKPDQSSPTAVPS